jgi:tetratricopeptide (TPR) repeat protein
MEIMRGNYQYANKYYQDESALTVTLESTDANFLLILGMAAIAEERYIEAQQLVERNLEIINESYSRMAPILSKPYLSLALRGLNKLQEAAKQLQLIIIMTIDTHAGTALVNELPVASALLVSFGRPTRAIEVYEAALQFPHVANAQFFEDMVGAEIKAVAAGRRIRGRWRPNWRKSSS